MKAQTKETQDKLSAKTALTVLKEGNKRFLKNEKADRNLLAQVTQTQDGQYPFAVVLSCIDSRVPVEHIFDQGVGDIFSVRVAGGVINEDVLGSIEYSCKVAGSKIVVVMGHTKCGAVTAACKGVELGNITALLSKIKPAVAAVRKDFPDNDYTEIVEKVILKNIDLTIEQIRKESPILAEMEKNGEIEIVACNYSVATGEVEFL